jgi:hypothetical protein
MNVASQDRVRELSQLVSSGEYEVDPADVAEAMVSELIWNNVPDLTELIHAGAFRRRSPRLRGLVRVRRLVDGPIPHTTALSA